MHDAPCRPTGMSRRTWHRWTPAGRRVFVETIRNLSEHWDMLAPDALKGAGTQRARRTLAWNAAWLAADAASHEE